MSGSVLGWAVVHSWNSRPSIELFDPIPLERFPLSSTAPSNAHQPTDSSPGRRTSQALPDSQSANARPSWKTTLVLATESRATPERTQRKIDRNMAKRELNMERARRRSEIDGTMGESSLRALGGISCRSVPDTRYRCNKTETHALPER